MGVVTKGDEGNEPVAGEGRPGEGQGERREEEVDERSEASEVQVRATTPAAAGRGGFFSIYKPGQGYWTRMGTVIGALMVLALVARFVFVALATRTALDTKMVNGVAVAGFPVVKLAIVGALSLVSALLLWWYLNKPSVVDFLIATESEMKKVNWTSRKELMGSTKVVILFMFLIAAALFVIDVVFGYFFFLIKVLKTGPFA
ncbi:MAG: preprotein translocase subunit SecE [Bacillota bacterium]